MADKVKGSLSVSFFFCFSFLLFDFVAIAIGFFLPGFTEFFFLLWACVCVCSVSVKRSRRGVSAFLHVPTGFFYRVFFWGGSGIFGPWAVRFGFPPRSLSFFVFFLFLFLFSFR